MSGALNLPLAGKLGDEDEPCQHLIRTVQRALCLLPGHLRRKNVDRRRNEEWRMEGRKERQMFLRNRKIDRVLSLARASSRVIRTAIRGRPVMLVMLGREIV
jgi:hypothetical protein